MALTDSLCCQDVGAEGRRRVMTLTGYDHSSVGSLDHDRLMATRMARSGNHMNPVEDLARAVKGLVAETGRVNQLRQGVVRTMSRFQFDTLGENRAPRQMRVPAAMVEVQMAVHDLADLGQTYTRRDQGCLNRHSVRPVMGVDIRMGPHPGVDHEHSVGVKDYVAQARFRPRHTGSCLFRGSNEITQVDATNGQVRAHVHTVGYADVDPS